MSKPTTRLDDVASDATPSVAFAHVTAVPVAGVVTLDATGPYVKCVASVTVTVNVPLYGSVPATTFVVPAITTSAPVLRPCGVPVFTVAVVPLRVMLAAGIENVWPGSG